MRSVVSVPGVHYDLLQRSLRSLAKACDRPGPSDCSVATDSDGRSDDVDPEEAAESILDATDSLLTAVEKARLVQRLLDTGTTTDRVALSSLLAEETAETSEAAARPVETDTDLPEACHARSNEAVLGMAVGELLDDAIQHADGSELRVELSLTARETVTIRVADNGPGIPEQDREAVLSGTETDLEHSSRISL